MKIEKKVIIIALFMFVLGGVYAQQPADSSISFRSELSIVIDDVFGKQSYVSYPYYDAYYSPISSYVPVVPINVNIPKIGLAYKFHFDKSAIRSKISYGSSSSESSYSSNDDKTNSDVSTFGLNLGYEWNKTYNKVQVFYGIDISMKVSVVENESSYTSEGTLYTNNSKDEYDALGISPLFGIKYYVAPNLSLSSEIKYIIESFEVTQTYKYSGNTDETKSEQSGSKTYFGPVGQISLNFHF